MTSARPASPTRPRATGSCCARCGTSTRGADAAVDARPAGPFRHPDRLPRRGRHQLPDARARPAAAHVRRHQAERADRGAPRGAGGAAGNPRSRRQGPGPRRHRHHRRFRADLAGRHDGRPGHRDRRELHRPAHRGGALLAGRHGPDEPAAPAAQRGVLPLRARRRPRAAAARLGQGGRDARVARPREDHPGLHARARGRAPGHDHDDGRLPGPGGRRRLRPRHHGAPAPPGRLRHRARPRGARAGGHPAVVAVRPHRPGRPGRGGHPAGGLREHPGRTVRARSPGTG